MPVGAGPVGSALAELDAIEATVVEFGGGGGSFELCSVEVLVALATVTVIVLVEVEVVVPLVSAKASCAAHNERHGTTIEVNRILVFQPYTRLGVLAVAIFAKCSPPCF